jgi:hypothetical protein
MLSTCDVTFHSTYVEVEGEDAVAAAPVVVGWLFQFTPDSVQAAPSRRA